MVLLYSAIIIFLYITYKSNVFFVSDPEKHYCTKRCGEGIQTKQIISGEKCNVTAFERCWVSNCPR